MQKTIRIVLHRDEIYNFYLKVKIKFYLRNSSSLKFHENDMIHIEIMYHPLNNFCAKHFFLQSRIKKIWKFTLKWNTLCMNERKR